jgi:D-glycero-alpha-D-manno-heptose-7-phosphate kinase
MIITRTPFRVSFAGGGTDLASFYTRSPGCVVSTTINKYMYIAVHPFFSKGESLIKYSKTERVSNPNDIKHPIVREAMLALDVHGIDLNSIADIPAGTGLGSSSAFTVGVLHALYSYKGRFVSKELLAREACEIEIGKLQECIGKQDQYASAYGGLNFISFYPDGEVNVEPIIMPSSMWQTLEKRLVLYYLGGHRSAGDILLQQDQDTVQKVDVFEKLKKIAELGVALRNSLQSGDLDSFGSILHEGWMLKKELSSRVSSDDIDVAYKKAMQNGAEGGKLLGAGGGGFVLFYCREENQDRLANALGELRKIPFSFDMFGSKVIYVGEKDF